MSSWRYPLYWIKHVSKVNEYVAIRESAGGGWLSNRIRLVSTLLLSLRLRQPTVVLPRNYIDRFVRLFPVPELPIQDKRHADYTVFPQMFREAEAAWTSPAISFTSRFALLILPIRFVLDHLLSFILLRLLTAFYLFGIVLLWISTPLYLRVRGMNPKTLAASNSFNEKKQWLHDYENYFDLKWQPIEFGFFLFKTIEGFQFRRSTKQFGFQHPNCEFGIEDGIISTLHLKGLDKVDQGCEVFPYPISGDLAYSRIENCFAENNPFPDRSFADIYLIHVVDHIPDLKPAFRELARITKPGGKVFFSGLSDTYRGYFLEQFVYQKTLVNNKSLEWYADLAKQYGFEIVYKSYCHAGLALTVWKFATFFHFRTGVWKLFATWYKRSAFVRYFYRSVRHTFAQLCLADEELVRRDKRGLNFMIVMQRIESN